MKKIITAILACLVLCTNCIPVSAQKYYTAQDLKNLYKIPTVNTLQKPSGLKVCRSSEAALVEWEKVEGAKYYKVYRKTPKSKYRLLATLKETTFTTTQDYKNIRFYVDIRYKKKKAKRYLYNKKYTYKIVAVGKRSSVKSSAKTVSKKWKKKKVEPSYYTLWYVNRKRAKKHLKPLYWGHYYEKGCAIRVKELPIRQKQLNKQKRLWNDLDHQRPKKSPWGTRNAETAFGYLRLFDPLDLKFYDSGIWGENVGFSSAGTEDILDGYMDSSGHRAIMMYSGNGEVAPKSGSGYTVYNGRVFWNKGDNLDMATFSLTAYTLSDNLLSRDDLTYQEMIIGDDEYVVSTAYGHLYNDNARKNKDLHISIPAYLYEPYHRIVPGGIWKNFDDFLNTPEKPEWNVPGINDFIKAMDPCNYLVWPEKEINWDNVYQIKKMFYQYYHIDIDAFPKK